MSLSPRDLNIAVSPPSPSRAQPRLTAPCHLSVAGQFANSLSVNLSQRRRALAALALCLLAFFPTSASCAGSISIHLTCYMKVTVDPTHASQGIPSVDISVRITNTTDRYLLSDQWVFGVMSGGDCYQCRISEGKPIDFYMNRIHPKLNLPPNREVSIDHLVCSRFGNINHPKVCFNAVAGDGEVYSSEAECK